MGYVQITNNETGQHEMTGTFLELYILAVAGAMRKAYE